MPDNQNENKFMAMLERRGIVRKTGSYEDNLDEAESTGTQSHPEADLRSLFNSPAAGAPKVMPISRQPIPGMSTPIMPSERQQQAESAKPQFSTDRIEREPQKPVERVEPAQTMPADEYALRYQPEAQIERTPSEQQEPLEAQEQFTRFDDSEMIRDASFKAEEPVAVPLPYGTYAAPTPPSVPGAFSAAPSAALSSAG